MQVLDVNENAPVFDRPGYSGIIQENAASGSTVAMVSSIATCILATNNIYIVDHYFKNYVMHQSYNYEALVHVYAL